MEKENTIQTLKDIVNDVINTIEVFEINYREWELYYHILLKTVRLQIPTIRCYELARALIMANVICETAEEEKKLYNKRNLLKESIYSAICSQQSDKNFNFKLYKAIVLKMMSEISRSTEKDTEGKTRVK